jgi:hypothetical protein
MNEETGGIDVGRTGWRNIMGLITIHQPTREATARRSRTVATVFLSFSAITVFCVTSCATSSSHRFSNPTSDWQSKSGQLMYHTPNTTLIGEVLVRFSKDGDFELTVSKGPGITLLSLRQDATFAEVKGGLADHGWSGPVTQAPPQLRGWLGLRDQFLHESDRKNLRYAAGNETFVFRF